MHDPATSRIWRLLIRLLPGEWRERHAAEMLAVHVALAGGAEQARGASFWLRVARDIVATAVQVRLDAVRGDVPDPTQRPAHISGDAIMQTVRLSFRSLRRTPGFAISVAAILALGMAANLTMFRVLDRVLLSPPAHIRAPDEVHRVTVLGKSIFTGVVGYNTSLTNPDYRQLRAVDAFAGIAAYGRQELTLLEDGDAERLHVELATASYFPTLGVSPERGRFFVEEEDRVEVGPGVAVLGHAFWKRRFGGDPAVIGRDLAIGRSTYTVVGIAPAGFTGVDLAPVDAWLPLYPAAANESGTNWVDATSWYLMAAVARVPDARIPAAEEAATRAHRTVREGKRGADPDARVVLTSLIAARGPNASKESRVARLLGLLTILVLFVTCANVGNLFLARVLSRRRELAVQAALGVSRSRLAAQLFAEVTILAAIAAVAALFLSGTAGQALFRVLLPDATAPAALGARIVLVTFGVAFLTAALTGVLPALRAMRADVMDTLRQARTGVPARRARRALLLAQAALSVVLLVGAGLFIRSLRTAESMNLGLDASTLAVTVELDGGIDFGDDVARVVYDAVPRLRENPMIESIAATSLAPFAGWWGVSIARPGADTVNTSPEGPFVYGVTGDYFQTLGVSIVRGRGLTRADDVPGAPPVAVVNEQLAKTLWPDENAIGQCIIPVREGNTDCTTVVGIAGNVVQNLTSESVPQIYYLPSTHVAFGEGSANTFLIRPRPGASAEAIRRAVLDAAPGVRFASVAPLAQRIAPQLRSWRLGASLLTAFGLLALVIAGAGLYSTLAFDVTQRRRELGVRAALGAPARRLIRSIVAGNLLTVAAGVVIGLVAAIAAGRAAEAMLFRVRAADPLVFVGVAGTLLVVGAVAAVLPARAATRVDPAITLREE